MERVGRNLIRGTAKLTFVDSASKWDDGTWQYRNTADGDSVSIIDVNDNSIPNIKYGIKITKKDTSNSDRYIDIFQNKIQVTTDCVYTMSAWVRGAGRYAFWTGIAGASFINDRYHDISEADKNKWIHISSQIRTNDSVISEFRIGSNVSVEICGFKLERGSVATPWSPAPEDSPSFAQCYLPRRASGRSIKKAVVQLDRDSFVYDGEEHVPKVTSVTLNGKALTEGQDYTCAYTPATDAGSYNVLVKGAKSYRGTIAAPWRIEKAANTITASPSEVSIVGKVGDAAQVALSFAGDGAVTVSESAHVTAQVDGHTLTLTGVSDGEDTLTVTVGEGTNYLSASCEVHVNVTIASNVFENNTWDTIAAICAAGRARECWNIGDEKAFTRRGTTYHFQIGDFDHDDLDPSDARYDDPTYNGGRNKAAITLIMEEIFADNHKMNQNGTNSTSWGSSEMRTVTIPQIKSEMDQDLISVIRTVTKKTAQGGDSSSIRRTADDLFLMSEVEVFGTSKYSHTGEGSRYEFFSAGNSPIKYQGTSAEWYWLRSPDSRYTAYFVIVNMVGGLTSTAAFASEGVVLCACI